MQVSRWVAIGLVCLLAGCGGGGGGGGGSPPPAADTTPEAFSFSAQTGTAPATVVASNEIVISGIDANAPISITGGEYSINGGAFTSAPGTVANNQTIRVRATSSTELSATVTVVLTIGGVSASFTVTTAGPDAEPDALSFERIVNATRGAQVTSNSVTVAGINVAAPISIENGEYSIDGGTFTSTAGSIRAGQTLTLRARAATTYSKATVVRVTVGTVVASFELLSELPNYVPDSIVFDGEDIVYLLSGSNRLIFRWSLAEERYLDAYVAGSSSSAPAMMTYSSSHERLYLGYSSGVIRYIDVTASSGAEVEFANIENGLGGVLAAGNYVWAEGAGYYSLHYTFDRNGTQAYRDQWTYAYSPTYTWDPVHSRVYLFRDGTSPTSFQYEVVDQATGQISSRTGSPYYGTSAMQGPIRVSGNGQSVLLGSGNIYTQDALTWSGSLGGQIADARWFSDGSLVTLSTTGNQTTLRHRAATNLTNLEQLTYTGQALRIVGTDAKMAALLINNSTVRFQIYVPNNDSDSDADGVNNRQDAFPLDPAASVDTDHDGYPDAWNTGRGPADSTTGLSLDAYPQDSACYLASHGNGANCNYAATVPNYVPDQVVQDGDTVYLLSSANRRVYRWSIASGAYLNPYVVGIAQGSSTLAPTEMAYSSSHQRLYLGYSTGAIQYIDVTTGGAEVQFAAVARAVGGLAAVGNYLLVQDYADYRTSDYVFDRDGVVTDVEDFSYYYASGDYAWDPVSSRLYLLRNVSPGQVAYAVIDQTNGQITSRGEPPYNNNYTTTPPVRVSTSGESILVGSGDIYNRNGLTWSRSLGEQIADARWFASGSLVTLSTANNQTTLRRRGTNLLTVEQLTYTGQALRVVGSDTRMAVLVMDGSTVRFHIYVPDDDSDDDGVTNIQDAFPLDPAASVDSDRDGYPDAWNAGRAQGDSTTGLSLDAYPQDSACYLSSHGTGATCNYSATVPNYVPDQVIQNGATVYLLSSANRRVYRWSIATASYLNPYIVGTGSLAPTKMAYSSGHQRLYLGYGTGAIQYIDVTSGNGAEVAFASTTRAVTGLAAVGNYVLAQDDSGYWGSHYIIDAGGVVTTRANWYHYSSEFAWDPASSRVYHLRDNTFPNNLMYEVIDQTTGQITSTGETPYHGTYTFQAPIRVSSGGQYVLVGSGNIFNRTGLTWAGSLGSQIADARWFANNSLAIVRTANNQTTLRRLGANLATLEQRTYAGTALRIVGSDTRMAVVVNNNGTVQFHIYEPSDDSDNDGVTNTQDAFPLDPAASVDTDRDGYPDAWNAGSGSGDSTTGLSLDAYPQDAACYLTSHGDGVNCDYAATIPSYVPDQMFNVGDTVYLLSSANRRVYRWSIATRTYLNPYIVGIDQGFSVLAPTKMAYSSAHQRLYLGYSTGAIRYIDVTSSSGAEVPFTNIPLGVDGVAAVGNYVLAVGRNNSWPTTHYILDSNGVTTAQDEYNYYSREFVWDPVSSRVYYAEESYRLYYKTIDQTTGLITAEGEAQYYSGSDISPPIRVSADGQRILVGNGDIYVRPNLTRWASLGKAIKDARWTDYALVDLDTTDRVEIRDSNTRDVLASYQYPGQPIGLVFGQTEVFLVHVLNNTTAFVRLRFYDEDGDSLPRWWEDLYNLSDSNAADALGDPDGDGVTNADEYLHHSSPLLVDTDGDGLSDSQEIVTYSTDPSRADTDGDGLDDEAEVVTHQSDPLDTDSDDDGYTDFDEVLYGGDPNDESGVPQPLANYSQSFENSSGMDAWSAPEHSDADWTVDSTVANTGAASLKSGTINNRQNSSIRFRGFFTAGQLSFNARVDSQYCCDRLLVSIDGVQTLYLTTSSQWYQYTIPITFGVHTIEWRYEKDPYSNQNVGDAHIDDVVFVGQ